MNWDSHIASSPISQSFFFKEVCYLILASSQRKLREYIEFLKFDVRIKKNKKFKFVQNLKIWTDSHKIRYHLSLSISVLTPKVSVR